MGVRPTTVALLPTAPGVYRFRDDRGRALYIGRAGDLRRRVASYWGDLRGRSHLRRMVPQIVAIEALACASEHEAAWVERMLLEQRKPRWNRVAGGLENPVFVRMDTAASAIRVTHEVIEAEGVSCYGPFLGGTATRMAVAAIGRVYPLTYTRSRLTGTERDLARLHGVGADDAAELIREIDLVLRGDATAVASARGLLVARRDEAACRELYELASRINDEVGSPGSHRPYGSWTRRISTSPPVAAGSGCRSYSAAAGCAPGTRPPRQRKPWRRLNSGATS
jgi:excinuclease ABC subunit C